MANIKIVVNGPLMDGHKLTFKAPCDCISVEKLKVCYVENATQKNRLFTMKDAHGNDLTGLGNLFSQGAYVDVVLDTVNGFAYLQNAGTNKYLEQKLTPVDNLESDRSDLPLSARMGSELNKKFGIELLWSNPKPNSYFSAQTVAVDTSKYSKFYVLSSHYDSANHLTNVILNVKNVVQTCIDMRSSTVKRHATVINSGIKFDDGYYIGNGSWVKDIASVVPKYIYGEY